MRLTLEDTVFVLVDVQGKLAQLMYEKDRLFENLQRIVKGVNVLGLPIVWMEQNPEKMGPTIPELCALLEGHEPIAKMSFGGCGDGTFLRQLESTGRKQVLIAGIETHVCVYQTSAALVSRGYAVDVVADAVSSRALSNKEIGLAKMQQCGVRLTSVEMALFELLGTAKHPAFRELLKIVK